MKVRAILLILVGMSVVGVACREDSQDPLNAGDQSTDVIVNYESLAGNWVRSFEEERQGSEIEVYRPHDSREFPPAWYRMRYVLNEESPNTISPTSQKSAP